MRSAVACDRLRGRHEVLGHLVPRDVEVDVVELGVRERALDHPDLVLDGAHDPPEPAVRPDDGRLRVALQQLARAARPGTAPAPASGTACRRRCAGSPRARPRRRSRGCGRAPGSSGWPISPAIFAETNSLWIVNSPMPEKTPGKVRSTRLMWSAAYMSAGLKPVIIGSKRACSSLRQRPVRHRDVGVGERVVVERRVRLQVVGRREVAACSRRPTSAAAGCRRARRGRPSSPMIFRKSRMSVPSWM